MTDGFLPDVGITQFQYNVGNQLMFVGIIVFEVSDGYSTGSNLGRSSDANISHKIPSNLVLYRVGPAVWIGCQIFAW